MRVPRVSGPTDGNETPIPLHHGAGGFRFEHTLVLSEAEYASLRQMTPPSWRQRALVLVLALAGTVLFAGRWTEPLGVILLLLAAAVWLFPRLARRGVRDEYVNARYLRGRVTYGVDETGMWVEGGPLRAASAWIGLVTWRRRGDWLLLVPSDMPPVLLPLHALEASGALEPVLALAKRYGVGES